MMLACLFLVAVTPFMLKSTEFQEIHGPSASFTSYFAEATKDKQNPITITNNIKPDMLTYKHWTGKYNPDSFKIFVNDAEIAQGASVDVPAATKTVDVKFDYSFVNGKRAGSKTVAYKLNDDITQANITFSWDNDNQIIIDNGTAVAS